jgi:hypothetical protein
MEGRVSAKKTHTGHGAYGQPQYPHTIPPSHPGIGAGVGAGDGIASAKEVQIFIGKQPCTTNGATGADAILLE